MTPRRKAHNYAIPAFLLALALPRLLRLLYPQVWLEDESYLTGAFLLSRGFLPYRDFPLPHFPLLEGMMAAVFTAFPVTIRTAEVVTQIAAWAGSVLVFYLGRRVNGPLTGAVAAVIFATSPLLFRYHVFEREVFVIVPGIAAVLAASSLTTSGRASDTWAIGTGMLLATALEIKLTAIAVLTGVIVQLVMTGHRRMAVLGAGTAIALVALLGIGLTAWFGIHFIVQVFLFRAVHASFPSITVKLDEWRMTMDLALAMGGPGAAMIWWSRRNTEGKVEDTADGRLVPLIQLACGFLFLVVLNPTFWAHTGIELLPWLSICGGYLVSCLVERSPLGNRVAWLGAAAAVFLMLYVSPLRNLNWEAGDGSPFGLGYRDRSEVDSVAAIVRAHSSPGDEVATPAILAFVANRREVVPYPEIAGEIEELTEAVRRNGYFAALRDPGLRHAEFWDSVEVSAQRVAADLAEAVDRRVPAVVINDSPDDLMPIQFVDVAAERLQQSGYRLESVSRHYEVWAVTR